MYFLFFVYLFISMPAQGHNASYNDEQKNHDYDNDNDDSLVAYPEGSILCLPLDTTLNRFQQSSISKDYLSKNLLDPIHTSLLQLPLDCCPKLTPSKVFIKIFYLNYTPSASWPLKCHCSMNSKKIGDMNNPNCFSSLSTNFFLFINIRYNHVPVHFVIRHL